MNGMNGMNGGGAQLTRFGAALLKIMAARGRREIVQLHADLKKKGKDYKPSRISNWLYGRHAVDVNFPDDLHEVYQLNEQEYIQLALAFTFGQREKIAADDPTCISTSSPTDEEEAEAVS